MIRGRQAIMMLLIAAWTGGCSSMLLPKSKAPVFYQIEYKAAPVECPASFDGGVRVWDFSVSPPYDRNQMVVLAENQEVLFSRDYQWAASPGTMVSKQIRRDLNESRLFSGGVVEGGLQSVPFEISGRIEKFACQRSGGRCEAVLDVSVGLDNMKLNKEVFHKDYRFRSEPFNERESAMFAHAMSRLVARFSEQLRRDLCLAASEVSRQ